MLQVTEKLIKQLKKVNLPLEDRSALTSLMLEKVNALPIQNSLVFASGEVIVNGKQLDAEQVINFRDSCIVLVDNTARKIIHEQLRYLAINQSVHFGLNTEQIVFGKAALWILEQEQKLIEKIVLQGTSFSA